MKLHKSLLHSKWLIFMVIVLAFIPMAMGCGADEDPAVDDAIDPDPPLEDPALDEESEPELDEDPDFDDVEDPDAPIEDPALDELEEES